MKLHDVMMAAAVSAAVATPAFAVELEKPAFYGYLSAGALKIEGADAEVDAFEIELGLQGKALLSEGLNLNYKVEVDLADAANNADKDPGPGRGRDGEGDIHVKEAVFWLPTKYGMFVVAPRGTSGQWRDIYGSINHYEYNEPHEALNPDGIFAQPDRTSGTMAYHTPWFMKTKLVAAAITLREYNEQDADGKSVRLVHVNGGLKVAIGTTLIAQEQVPTNDDYLISAAGVSYKKGGLTLGAVWENNQDSPYRLNSGTFTTADFDSYGVSAYYVADSGAGAALGYKEKNHDFDAADESVYTLKVEQRITPQMKVWVETGQYEELPSNYAVGLNVTF
ncbi:porin [Marinobacter maritimus]|uniref:porin n=1 Tax=Marinobacter maritimus TaxID=277961 RepID=UPI0011A0DFF9|nr:porin [Marinobacter maritimus]